MAHTAPEILPQFGGDTDFCAAVRGGFAYVAAQAQHVRINYDAIAPYAAQLPDEPLSQTQTLDAQHHFSGNAEDTAGYILMLDSINFGSGYCEDLVAEGWALIDNGLYYTISTRLKYHCEQQGCPDPAALAGIDQAAIIDLLQLGDGPHSAAFAGQCAQSLRQMARAVQQSGTGSWAEFVFNHTASVNDMISRLITIESFQDIQTYKGRMIPFYKRAQITVADIHLAFARLGHNLFPDINKLTMFADNGVPHVLHLDGILDYSPALAADIRAGREIPAGSEQETELRGCAGQAVELIAAEKGLSPMAIDHILWHRSAEDERYLAQKPHLTKTVFY